MGSIMNFLGFYHRTPDSTTVDIETIVCPTSLSVNGVIEEQTFERGLHAP